MCAAPNWTESSFLLTPARVPFTRPRAALFARPPDHPLHLFTHGPYVASPTPFSRPPRSQPTSPASCVHLTPPHASTCLT